MQDAIEDKITELKIKELVGEREELYRKIKEKLTPLILKSIKDAEKVKGYKVYWKLYEELFDLFGLIRDDYEIIISELELKERLIQKRWSSGIGGYMMTTNT